MENQKLNSLQLELLNVYSFEPNEEDLLAIKKFLANYFSVKLQNKIEHSIRKNSIKESDLDSWINEKA